MLSGVYRGTIADTNDPETRKRYRVRVFGVHRDEVPVEAIPWAETCLFAGKGFGDIPAFAEGDVVWIMFEQGDRRFPVVMGGCLTHGGGTNDTLSELTGDYGTAQQRWVRADRSGQKIEMSPLPDERWITIQSGDSRVKVRDIDGTIEIAAAARVVVSAPNVQVRDATTITIEGGAVTTQTQTESNHLSQGATTVQSAQGVKIGTHTPTLPALPVTTPTVAIDADSAINFDSRGSVGVTALTRLDIDAQGDIRITTAQNITIEAASNVVVQATGSATVQGADVTITSDTGPVSIQVAAECTLDAAQDVALTAGGDVHVTSGGELHLQVTGPVKIDALGNVDVQSAGTAIVRAAGLSRIESSTRIELVAPVVEVQGSGALNLRTGGTLTAQYSQGLFGV